MERLAKATYISCIDLRSGFYQIAMDPASAHKTGFAGPNGVYEYKRMPMGISSAPSIFTRAMNLALAGLQGSELEIYLDDVMVHGETLDEHNTRFKRMLDRFATATHVDRAGKMPDAQERSESPWSYCWQRSNQSRPCKNRGRTALSNAHDSKEGQTISGPHKLLPKIYQRLCHYSSTAAKIAEKDSQNSSGRTNTQNAFHELINKLCEYPVLRAPDLEKPFLLTTDASDYAIGAILGQGEIGSDYACAYASRCLKSAELRYPTYDKELLAVVFGKEQFYYYLWGRKFTVVTDHQPLVHFHKTKKPELRFNRLKAELRGYEFSIVYRRGRVNNNVDALSRNPTSCDTSDLTRAQLYELADKQEREDNDLSGEKDHPPGRIFTIRTKRVTDGGERIDKDKYEDNSDCDSTDFFQQVTRKHRRTESPMPLVRQAKLDAKRKISDIINLDKRPRKTNSHCIADNTKNAFPARSHNAQKSRKDEEENIHLNAESEPHTTQKN
ncbi:unnamed protein product [Trichogramma brassicae]|uniref:Reverse transcriptase domain-containing protein n=1 Tax=Trichogramma brassicae TaxID=86971 RepID=A0A6H5I3H3_9HYME|nr:unnamed protein product [Trichogramma brassicae]